MHGISFKTAIRIFDGRVLTAVDNRFDYGEVREISIGVIDSLLCLVVIHTDRGGSMRTIAARGANRRERKRYVEAIR